MTLTIVFPALTALSKSYQTVMKSIPKVLNWEMSASDIVTILVLRLLRGIFWRENFITGLWIFICHRMIDVQVVDMAFVAGTGW